MTATATSPCRDKANQPARNEMKPKLNDSADANENEELAVGTVVRLPPATEFPCVGDDKPCADQKIVFFHNETACKEAPILESSRHMSDRLKQALERLADEIPHYFQAGPVRRPVLLIRRAWAAPGATDLQAHREARAADIWLAHAQDNDLELSGPHQNTLLTDKLPVVANSDFVLICAKSGRIRWRSDGQPPSPANPGTLLEANHQVGFRKSDISSLWLRRENPSDTIEVLVRSCFLRTDEDDVGLLGCVALECGFEFVHHYSEDGDQLWGIHGSVLLGDLSRLKAPADWAKLEDGLRRRGWVGLFNDPLFGPDPFIVFPGDEMLVQRIQIVPVRQTGRVTLGEVLLQTAWSRGLSPRPLYLSVEDRERGRLMLPFHPAPARIICGAATQPTTVDTLEKAIGPYKEDNNPAQFWTCKKSPRGKPLHILIGELTAKSGPYHGITIQAHANLLPQWVCIPEDAKLPEFSTLTNIMDAVAAQLLATWDWYGPNRIMIVPLPGYGFCGECYEKISGSVRSE